MKTKSFVALALFAASGLALAEAPVELTAAQMDGVTAGSSSALMFALEAIGASTALTQIEAVTLDQVVATAQVQLTKINYTMSSVGAAGIAQAF